AYAAPEFFSGQTARQSDQYCLAVTYCELRTGELPFSGSAAEVMTGHIMGTPNLSALPECERPIVGRALAKKPADRWPTCRAFMEALRKSQVAEAPSPLRAGPPRRSTSPANPSAARTPWPETVGPVSGRTPLNQPAAASAKQQDTQPVSSTATDTGRRAARS